MKKHLPINCKNCGKLFRDRGVEPWNKEYCSEKCSNACIEEAKTVYRPGLSKNIKKKTETMIEDKKDTYNFSEDEYGQG